MATTKDSAPAKPVHVFRLRGITASVFENHSTAGGRDVTFLKVSLQRTYKDGDAWKTTTSFGRDDLPVATLLLQRAWAFVLDAEAALATASKYHASGRVPCTRPDAIRWPACGVAPRGTTSPGPRTRPNHFVTHAPVTVLRSPNTRPVVGA